MISALSKFIYRPPRSLYSMRDLPSSPTKVEVNFVGSRGLNVTGTYYPSTNKIKYSPCVIYLHGNSSCQLEGAHLRHSLNVSGINLLCIDTTGCGHSEGQTIGLGVFEKIDSAKAAEFVRNEFGCEKVILWGRSMGAVASLFCAVENVNIDAIIVDSGFITFDDIVTDIFLVKYIYRFIYKMLRMDVKENGHFDINDLNFRDKLENGSVPALFIHAFDDNLIRIRHSEEMFRRYGCSIKYFATCSGTHNSCRPDSIGHIALEFILKICGIDGPSRDVSFKGDENDAYHYGSIGSMVLSSVKQAQNKQNLE